MATPVSQGVHDAVRPLLAFDGLLTVLVTTRDGLPVEMIGHGLHADKLAAEAISILLTAEKCSKNLGLGKLEFQVVQLENYELVMFDLAAYVLVLVFEAAHGQDVRAVVEDLVKPKLHKVLGGNA